MNKKGVFEGLTWFFAIIVVTLILILFHMSSSFLLNSPNQRGEFYLGDFYKLDSLRQIMFMEDYDHIGVYNNFSYQIYLSNGLTPYLDFTNFLASLSKDIFVLSNSGSFPAFLMFSFRSNYQEWSVAGMPSSGSGKHSQKVSESENSGNLLYPESWDMALTRGDIKYPVNRLYRIYFLNKDAAGFVRFGISAVQREYGK